MTNYLDKIEVKISVKDLQTLKSLADGFSRANEENESLKKEIEILKAKLEKNND